MNSNNYFDILPAELNTIILSYTLPRDYKSIIQIISNVDYHQLFKLQFNRFYHKSIVKYNVEKIYKDLIELIEYEYITKSITKYKTQLYEEYIYDFVNRKYLIFIFISPDTHIFKYFKDVDFIIHFMNGIAITPSK